jgi:3-deoxy-manno-octulosonate cytidylyltransferase (CMP-KDO synthetase)
MHPLIVIPARLASTRLPRKVLLPIGGLPMVLQVLRRAEEAGIGPAIIACDSEEIVAVAKAAGATAILTDPDHPSGSDRVWEAVAKFDPQGKHDIIVNLQGDVPTLDPQLLRAALAPLKDKKIDMATLATEIKDKAEHDNPSVVKAVIARNGNALYFTRAPAPAGEGPRYHHIGVYVYRREALQKFVALPPSPLEQREKLEQLRALENGMTIAIVKVDTLPLGVDTAEDLEKARAMLGGA